MKLIVAGGRLTTSGSVMGNTAPILSEPLGAEIRGHREFESPPGLHIYSYVRRGE